MAAFSEYDLLVAQNKLKSCFSFGNDLTLGKNGELFVETIFDNPDVKLEVKKDDWVVKSGNIAIEFESRGKASGILTTQAHFWCHIVGNYFVLVFPVDFLRQTYEALKSKPKYVKEMGDRDGNGKPTSKAILIPWHELLQLFKSYSPFQTPSESL